MAKIDRNLVWFIAGLMVIIFAFVVLLSFSFIGYSVKEKCQLAQEKYSGDCVEALTAYLKDDNNSFRSRNSAVWALGELGDERALPALGELYTGETPNKESLTQGISQYELDKAIRLIESGLNLTAFVWRHW